jgi:hypothetical protein
MRRKHYLLDEHFFFPSFNPYLPRPSYSGDEMLLRLGAKRFLLSCGARGRLAGRFSAAGDGTSVLRLRHGAASSELPLGWAGLGWAGIISDFCCYKGLVWAAKEFPYVSLVPSIQTGLDHRTKHATLSV